MNFLVQTITTAVALTLSLSLASCQQEGLIDPIQPSAGAVNDIITPTLSKTYTLTKCGQDNLTYYADGRLKQVMDGPDVRGSQAVRKEYAYSPGLITVMTYSGPKLLREETFWIEAATGRCYQSKALKHTGSFQESIVNLYYTYNAKGQLTKCDSHDISGWTDYTYNAAGDLTKAIDYSAFSVPLTETTFNYDAAFGDPVLVDVQPLNSEWTCLTDRYLPIFGKPSKHLIKLVTIRNLLTNGAPDKRLYNYTVNPDGYVTERKQFTMANAALVESKLYDYAVTNVGLQF